MTDPYRDAEAFAALFRKMEHDLKRSAFLKNTHHAQADWNKFARELGMPFFDAIKASGRAKTLLGEPPRKLMRERLEWLPLNPRPLANVVELFEQGVCRVRNSFVHGEKFVSGEEGQRERDATLIREALFVLNEAKTQFEGVNKRGEWGLGH
ncbi:MAG: hypothetical protein E5X51_17270 [Mesorhizobium sp.]|uniref:hypothetical protein n=1 Tax=Mesorhizobium sp. TaxID=1871066 RepID=UPI0012073F7B|nr:hypothetical protein [Mesorhizobium sp.]TIQ20141.1 MAG: hypothetical protein E5X51_17270 [Mesorhizobium sp.]